MKKTIITLTIVLGMAVSSFAQSSANNGGLFGRGSTPATETSGSRDGGMLPQLPSTSNTGDHDATESSPLGSGIAMLLGLGGAYLVAKKRREE